MLKSLTIRFFKISLLLISFHATAQEEPYITSKFDFIPGEKIIFYDDFTMESIGDLPTRWITNGSGEVVTYSKYPGRWFLLSQEGYFMPEARENFTENFTVEFDMISPGNPDSDGINGIEFFILSASLDEPKIDGQPGEAGWKMRPYNDAGEWSNWSLMTEQSNNGAVNFTFKSDQKYHISLWIQKHRVRMYADENKILDLAQGLPSGSVYNIFRIEAYGSQPLISEVRIAAGIPDFRNQLNSDGKFIASGILFDPGSEKIRPESYSTLKMIADLLKGDPSLNMTIIGHTDSEGDDKSNTELSKLRSIAVKEALVSKFSCDESKLSTDGKGESQPVADNSKAEGRATNRRVEFSKSDILMQPAFEKKTVSGNSKLIIPSDYINSIVGDWLIDIPRCTSDDSTQFLSGDLVLSIKTEGKEITLESKYTNTWNNEKVTESEKFLLTGELYSKDDKPYLKLSKLSWSDEGKSMIINTEALYGKEKVAILQDNYILSEDGKTLSVKGKWQYPTATDQPVRNVTVVYTRKK